MDEKASPFGDLPEGTESPRDAGEQEREGLTPRQQRMAALLTRLAATSRSFLLYDPRNDAIHRFLTALLDALVSALAEEGPLTFVVQPFEIAFEGQPVYLNRDRERSLAFRLYRDGVRQLRFRPGFDGEELARLLGILSTRYTGLHQNEDDVVTLIWKASFAHLDTVAVEGIVPDAPEEEVLTAPGWDLPNDVDLPPPLLPTPQAPVWADVAPERRDELRGEASAGHLGIDCLLLAQEVRECLNDPAMEIPLQEAAHVFGEIRDYLLSEYDLVSLKGFLTLLWRMSVDDEPPWDRGRHSAVYELLESCGSRSAVRRVLASLPGGTRRIDPILVEVMDRACPDPLLAVADCLPEERSEAVRAAARQLLERYGADRLDVLVQRFEISTGDVASDFLRVIAGIGGEEAASFVARQVSHKDPAVVDEALWHLEHMPYSGGVGRALFEAFRLAAGPRRARILALMSGSKDPRFVDLLSGYVEENAPRLSVGEGAQIGQVLGGLAGAADLERWSAWLRPAGRFRKGLEGPLARQVAAALALSEIPGPAAREILVTALDVAEPEARQWVLGALGQRERRLGERA
jgi:hypothetical protein